MRATSVTELRKNLASELDRVENDREPLIIVRSGKPAAVLISLEDYGSWAETDYLLSSPANRERLREAIAQYEQGKVIEVPWPE